MKRVSIEERVPKLLFFYQTRDTFTDDGEFIEASGARARSATCPLAAGL